MEIQCLNAKTLNGSGYYWFYFSRCSPERIALVENGRDQKAGKQVPNKNCRFFLK
jgi:hypothetical protein